MGEYEEDFESNEKGIITTAGYAITGALTIVALVMALVIALLAGLVGWSFGC